MPGWRRTRSTRPSVAAAIQRTFSGTSTPLPRTARVSGPRPTVSMTSEVASTGGAAGSSRAKATLVSTIAPRTSAA